MILNPLFIVADEPVSMLDVSIRSGVMNLMLRLREERKITYLFVSHDISTVRYMSDRIAIMYAGKVVEIGSREDVIQNPAHPYTKILLSAVPVPDPDHHRKRMLLRGEPPGLDNIPEGCRFHPRCPSAKETCKEVEPDFQVVKGNHIVACPFLQ